MEFTFSCPQNELRTPALQLHSMQEEWKRQMKVKEVKKKKNDKMSIQANYLTLSEEQSSCLKIPLDLIFAITL